MTPYYNKSVIQTIQIDRLAPKTLCKRFDITIEEQNSNPVKFNRRGITEKEKKNCTISLSWFVVIRYYSFQWKSFTSYLWFQMILWLLNFVIILNNSTSNSSIFKMMMIIIFFFHDVEWFFKNCYIYLKSYEIMTIYFANTILKR